MSKLPPKTGVWSEESVTVTEMTPVMDGKKVRFEPQEKQYTEKVMYFDAPKVKVMCKDETHKFIPLTPNRFGCENCKFQRIAHPVTYKYNPETKQLDPR